MPVNDRRFHAEVARQSHYLTPPVTIPGDSCVACYGAKGPGYTHCKPCQAALDPEHRLADAVVPISYALKGEQHAQVLTFYKRDDATDAQRFQLHALLWMFLNRHQRCLVSAAGGRFSHLVIVPSTRGRTGVHPLARLVTLSLPTVAVTVNTAHAGGREFHTNRFEVRDHIDRARVLIIDDTWTTGARVQSLSHALKVSGAASTVAVVLGRRLNLDYPPTAALWRAAQRRRFSIAHCVLEAQRLPPVTQRISSRHSSNRPKD
ncbi:putative amidophosphoribosyltransferase [Stackebrandtia albiflava]|uniref:Putative amidophosphoribosyltransferase n=1 Tax=Stackebrandtia albiflava TaxID=406432 RepID=A0A562URE8_9ACTN|nr:hypothetical protein [Stackebrandtia albiflava]TWJ08186.1 putative amidophosphoribosyltransferase [Stackebrandtia albiflava]